MRIERRYMGDRVRITLNKTDIQSVVVAILLKQRKISMEVEGAIYKSVHIGSSTTIVDPSTVMVNALKFEKACKELVEKKHKLPRAYSFRTNTGDLGVIVSATFQYYSADVPEPMSGDEDAGDID